ncbi:MAG: hypothetical protein G01um10143_412 [Parcubacteria group bacterium Gr01-1014_3]|nr:MAG: hypothetical protein G01um10143_412 [Parcubacteria group bacterium Gr01-1014_3]
MKSKSIILGLLVISGLLAVILGWEPISAATRKIRPTAFTGKNTIKQVSKTSLLGSWDFNECDICTTVADLSGNARNGTTYNNYGTNAVNLRSSDGIRGRSVILDGVNDYVSMADNDVWDFTGDFTISVWAKFTTVNTAGDWHETPFIAHDAGSGAGTRKWIFTYDGDASSNTLFHINSPGSCSATIEGNNWTPATGIWYQVGVTRVGTTYTFYLDGKFNGSTVDTCGIMNAGAPLLIGWAEGGAKVFDGRIDEVKIYTRALSESEMERIYNENRLPMKANASQNNRFTDGLVGFWPFNGPDVSGVTAYDRSSNVNNGTLTGGVATAPGVVGQALSFDGSNDLVTMGDPGDGSLDFGTGDFTISFWVKQEGTATRVFVGKRGVTANLPGYTLFYNAPTEEIKLGLNDSTASHYFVVGDLIVNSGAWHHLLVSVDRTSDIAVLYKDGASQGNVDIVTGASDVSTAGSFQIGSDQGTGGTSYKGVIDEVRVYNRALSATEAKQIYNSSKH